MKQLDLDQLRGLTGDHSVVLVTATEAEAEPLRAALEDTRVESVGTKTLFLGELPAVACILDECDAASCGHGSPRSVRVVLAIGGCDKANTAHVLTCLLEAMRPAPSLVLQVGVAGAFRAPGNSGSITAAGATTAARSGPVPEIGDLVLATQEAYSDTGSSSPEGWLSAAELGLPIAQVNGADLSGVFPLDMSLVEAAREALTASDSPWSGRSGPRPTIHVGPCVTSSQATGLQAEADALYRRWGAIAESMEGAAAAHICALYGVQFLEIRGISNLVGDRDRAAWQVERAVAVAGEAALAVVAALSR